MQQSSSPAFVCKLEEVVDVQRVDMKPFCVELEIKDKLLYFAFRNDEEVYGWMEDIYSRSPLMGVSGPTNFVHNVHVGFDPISGGFTVSSITSDTIVLTCQGLPASWSKLLTSSAITKEEAARNPEAVIDVLQFYTQQQLGQGAGDYQAPSMPTMPSASRTNSSAAARFEGVGLGGSQQAQQSGVQQQRDREREIEREKERDRERQKERELAIQREKDRERERERERERAAALMAQQQQQQQQHSAGTAPLRAPPRQMEPSRSEVSALCSL